MYNLFSITFFCLFSFFGTLCLQAYQSAHVITVGIDTDKTGKVTKKFVLLGLLKNGKLSTFGGLRDPQEDDPKNTAAREAEEEALGVLGNKKTIRDRLKGVNPCFEVNGHICYVLPQKNYGQNVSARFKKIRFDPNSNLSYSQKEMVDVVAVEVDKIRKKVLEGNSLKFKDNEGILRPIRVEAPFIEAIMNGQL